MKTQEEMAEFFRSLPTIEKANPYWSFDEKSSSILRKWEETKPFVLTPFTELLKAVREYFRRMYESFGTEAQVLVVDWKDSPKLMQIGIPKLEGTWKIADMWVNVFVLPQVNTPGNSIISEKFWQKYIVEQGIVPVTRIHSHYILDAYQSATDYSTLNSNTLEMVMGRITDEKLHVAYWLDEHGKDTKSNVFKADETENGHYGINRHKSTYGIPLDVIASE